MTFRIFQEPREGIVRHTGASKALADNPLLRQWVGMISDELWPAATKVGQLIFTSYRIHVESLQTVDAITKWPKCEEPNNSVSSGDRSKSLLSSRP